VRLASSKPASLAESDLRLLAGLPLPRGWRVATRAELAARGMAEGGHPAAAGFGGRGAHHPAWVAHPDGWHHEGAAGRRARLDTRRLFLAADWHTSANACLSARLPEGVVVAAGGTVLFFPQRLSVQNVMRGIQRNDSTAYG
jgi:hypothetical protein